MHVVKSLEVITVQISCVVAIILGFNTWGRVVHVCWSWQVLWDDTTPEGNAAILTDACQDVLILARMPGHSREDGSSLAFGKDRSLGHVPDNELIVLAGACNVETCKAIPCGNTCFWPRRYSSKVQVLKQQTLKIGNTIGRELERVHRRCMPVQVHNGIPGQFLVEGDAIARV